MSAHVYRRRLAAVALAGSATLLLAAGCGDSGASGGSDAPGGDGQNALAAYAACLKEQGIEVTVPTANPRPSGGAFPQGSGRPTAFPSGLPSGGPGGGLPSGGPGGAGQPSGGPGGGGQRGGGGFANSLKPEGVDEAAWTKATEACADSLPQMGNGRNGGGGPGGAGPGGGDNGAAAAYDNCLTENGVTDTAALNTADATTAKAVEACAPLKPAA